MKAILSPAKTLDLTTAYPDGLMENTEKPILEKQADTLVSLLKGLSPTQIGKLMSVSPKLAKLNHERFQTWRWAHTKPGDDLRPAVYMFRGDVYQGIDPQTLTPDQVKMMNAFTYILSGLYGILKPLTLIRPYRLEMGTSLKNPRGENLYHFWGKTIADVLNKELLDDPQSLLVNLASEEYYSAVKPHLSPEIPIIHPVFLDRVKGNYKIVSFYAKKARGLMVRFMIKDYTHPKHLQKFNLEGYYFSPKETEVWNQKKFPDSKRESTLVFLRDS